MGYFLIFYLTKLSCRRYTANHNSLALVTLVNALTVLNIKSPLIFRNSCNSLIIIQGDIFSSFYLNIQHGSLSIAPVTASLDPKVNGKISLVAFAYIVCANCISALIGISVALIIKPGDFSNCHRY